MGDEPDQKKRKLEARHVGVIGDFFVDIQASVPQLPSWDSDVETNAIELLPGGCAANTARQLSALIDRVTFFSTCSDDLLGTSTISLLRKQNFDTNHMISVPLPSSACIVLSGPSDRGFVSCYSSINALTADKIDATALRQCSHVHVGGYLNVRGLHSDSFTALLCSCREAGASISIATNAAPTGKWLGEGDHLRQVLPLADLFFLNAAEHQEVEKALGQHLHGVNPSMTIVETRGRDGIRVHTGGGGKILDMSAQVVDVPTDLTGAGDSFVAGFLAKWVCDRDLQKAGVFGAATAACNVRRRGACWEPIPESEILAQQQASSASAQ